MAKRKRRRGALDRQIARELTVLKAYQRHFGSTTQREDAAAELGWTSGTSENSWTGLVGTASTLRLKRGLMSNPSGTTDHPANRSMKPVVR
jgi:hypothetical protein